MEIIYQDEQILVVNKPAGLAVLPEGWEQDAPYLVKLLEVSRVGDSRIETTGNPATGSRRRIWVVHRIDKITSGVIIFALTAESHRALNIQFEKHKVEKKYHAIVNGSPKWDEKTVKFPLRVNVGHKHRTMVDDKHGVKAETRFKVVKRAAEWTLLEALPMTGRTHQIRVHAYALGHPLLGDTLYSAPETHLISRPALHAYSLTVTHPTTNERMTFNAPYPADIEEVIR